MSISVFDLFKIGIGPSSSHTVGPMKAAFRFAEAMQQAELLARCDRLRVELYGSLGATGSGHGTPKAIMLGLLGEKPESVAVEEIETRLMQILKSRKLDLLGTHTIDFDIHRDLQLRGDEVLAFHANGMRFECYDALGGLIFDKCYYSVGGGFVVDESEGDEAVLLSSEAELAYPFTSAAELLAHCEAENKPVSEIMRANELTWRSTQEIDAGLQSLRQTMFDCIDSGCQSEGVLPGGLNVRRRAAKLYRSLKDQTADLPGDSLNHLDWVTLYALSVNEVNAMGGRMVTAPTNGAAGIVPAVLRYFMDFCVGASEKKAGDFLLTAGAIGILYKVNASISGAEVGCQGEVGSACSMAAGALAEVLGGSPRQVENAAEIAMEHNLGLTCDPIGGLVQVPCIERNAMAAIKAISAARMALRGDGRHHVSLDQVIHTMRETGRDMQEKYKETALGGLAVHVAAVPVSVIEC